jgi:hypothetical protein
MQHCPQSITGLSFGKRLLLFDWTIVRLEKGRLAIALLRDHQQLESRVKNEKMSALS